MREKIYYLTKKSAFLWQHTIRRLLSLLLLLGGLNKSVLESAFNSDTNIRGSLQLLGNSCVDNEPCVYGVPTYYAICIKRLGCFLSQNKYAKTAVQAKANYFFINFKYWK